MILDVRRIRVTFVAIGTLYPTDPTQMANVVIEIFPAFKCLAALTAVQSIPIEKRCTGAFHGTNLAFRIARILHMEDQITVLGEGLAALRTLCHVRLRTRRRQVVPF